MIFSNFLFIILTTFLINSASGKDVTVDVTNGTIKGKTGTTEKGLQYYIFKGIPYAAPPVGNLRFEPPQPALGWNGTLDAKTTSVKCFQVSKELEEETEDCLLLNIYTTQIAPSISPLLPVIIWVHGGAFKEGSGGVNPRYLLDYGVVFVGINYRLGPFGFLSTGDEIIPGNNGLRDQQLAIRWVKENITPFGGNPEQITLMGQSAGASSINYQLLDPKNEGLFQGVIAESGSYLSPWSYQRNARDIAFKTAGYINQTFNSLNDSKELLAFLKSVPAKQIDDASAAIDDAVSVVYQTQQGFVYAPVIEVAYDAAFLTSKMYSKAKSGNYIKVPILIGIDSEESINSAADLAILKSEAAAYDKHLDTLVPDDMGITNATALESMGGKIRSLYTNGLLQDDLAATIKYLSDTGFSRGVIRQAQLQSSFSPVYFYQFSYHGQEGNQPVYVEGADRCAHGEEKKYIFDNGKNITDFTEGDQLTARRLLEMWTNFAKFGKPTLNVTSYVPVSWPNVTSNTFYYLNINDTLTVKTDPKGDIYKGWVALYDSVGTDNFDTY